MAGAIIQQQIEPVKLTLHCYLVAVVGCMGGLSFGYEGPVISGLIINPHFLHIFEDSSSSSSTAALASQGSSYCKLNSTPLQLYISSQFITAALATAAAATWADRFGRKTFILTAASLILTANVLQTVATGRTMLFIGRLMMGFGQGFATFTVPMYVAEMSPSSVRGRLGTVYSIATTIGQLLAFAINQAVYAADVEFSWRIVFAALAWCPLVMLLLLTTVLPDTPSSLLQRGQLDKARMSYAKLRHSSAQHIDLEWLGMCDEAHRVVSQKKLQHHHHHHQQQQQQQRRRRCWPSVQSTRPASVLAGPGSIDVDYDAAASVKDTTAAAAAREQELATITDSSIVDNVSNSDVSNNAAQQLSIAKPWSAAATAGSQSAAASMSSIADMDPEKSVAQYAAAAAAGGEPAPAAAAAAAADVGGTGSIWPALIIMLHMTVLRSFNGFVNIMYFTALLFSSTGNSTQNSLLAQTLMGVSTLLGGVAAMLGIDKIGRRPLLTYMGFIMAAFMAAAAAILGNGLPPAAAAAGTVLSPGATAGLMIVLCLWQIAFWSSWGPCFYVVLSELYPLRSRARSVGWGMVTFNLSVVILLTLGGSMLCAMTYGLLIFFAGVNLYLALFAAACSPEMRGKQLHEVAQVYMHHWLWRHAYRDKEC